MQKPTLCIYANTHVQMYTRVYNTPMSIYHYLFSKMTYFEVSQVSRSQKQALVNAIQYVCALTRSVLPLKWEKRLPPKRRNPLPHMRHNPQREFATAKLQQIFDIYKKICTFIQIYVVLSTAKVQQKMTYARIWAQKNATEVTFWISSKDGGWSDYLTRRSWMRAFLPVRSRR